MLFEEGGKLTGSNDVLVLEWDTLWSTSGSGGVHDTAEVFWRWWNWLDWGVGSKLDQLINGDNADIWVGFVHELDVLWVNIVLGVVDDKLDLLRLLEWVDDVWKKVWVEEDSLCAGSDERVLQSLLPKSVVCGDNGHCLGRRAVRHAKPVGTGCGKDVDAVVLDKAEVTKTRADGQNHLLVVGEGAVGVAGKLKVSPDLVDLSFLAINDLLNLLGLLVRLDELARAESLCVAILGGSIHHNIVGGLDLSGWLGNESVKEIWVATWNSLACSSLDASDLLRERSFLVDAWLDGGLLELWLLVVVRQLVRDVRHDGGVVRLCALLKVRVVRLGSGKYGLWPNGNSFKLIEQLAQRVFAVIEFAGSWWMRVGYGVYGVVGSRKRRGGGWQYIVVALTLPAAVCLGGADPLNRVVLHPCWAPGWLDRHSLAQDSQMAGDEAGQKTGSQRVFYSLAPAGDGYCGESVPTEYSTDSWASERSI